MAEQTSYEVQVMQGGSWRIHAQFPHDGKEDAVEEAKTLESMSGIGDIKVVRDSFDASTGLHNEHIVYKVSRGGGGAPPPKDYSKLVQRGGAKAPQFDTQSSASKRSSGSSGLGVLSKLLLVIIFSLAIASVVTGISSSVIPFKKVMGIAMYGKNRANVLFFIFIVFFVVSASFTFRAFMARDELNIPERNQRPAKPKADKRRQKQEIKTKEEKTKREERKRREEERKQKEEKRKKEEAADIQRKADEEAIKAAEEALGKAKEEAGAPEEEAPEEAPEEEAAPDEELEPMLSAHEEQQKLVMMSFFGESIKNLPAERKKMDNYNRFGVNLYLAGATEALGSERGLDTEVSEQILSDSLQVMGMAQEQADAFSKRYEEYLLTDARYMQMFQFGRRDMSGYIGGDGSSALKLDDSLHEWNKPAEPENPEKQIVVMFTDIVGSTAMTHEKGNLGAQEIVRAHNKVVREALSKFRGDEIKHTGDGIMASFEKVNDSLNATAHMQRLIQIHNQNEPSVPLKVKIGIAMGSVVVEENDLYGVTVQMAARIVDKAAEGLILVSDTVYGMAKGGDVKFIKRGPYLMKGIDGPASLYQLLWDDKADLAQLQAEADAENALLSQQPGLPEQAPAPATAQPSIQTAPLATPTTGTHDTNP